MKQWIDSLSIGNQEEWYREMLIRSRLERDVGAYQKYRDGFLRILIRQEKDIPHVFAEGVINFYDGVLLCIDNKNNEALPYLDLAAKQLVKYPKYTTALFNMNLNVLLLGKGMMAGSGCKESISRVISTGE